MARFGRGVLFACGVTLALVLTALAFVASPWGGARLAGVVEALASREIAGTIRVGAIRVGPGLALHVERALLLAPDGTPVASLGTLDAYFSLVDLLGGTLRFDLVIDRLLVEESSAGALSAALRPVSPQPATEPAPPPSPPIPLEWNSLSVARSGFRLVEAPEGEKVVDVRDVALRSRGRWGDEVGEAEVSLAGQVWAPLQAPLGLEARAALSQWRLTIPEAMLHLGASRVAPSGSYDFAADQGEGRADGSLHPTEARGLGLPLAQPIAFGVDARREEERLDATALLRSEEGGVLRVEGWLGPGLLLDAALRLTDVQLSRWLDDAPAFLFDATGRFRGDLGGEPSLDGDLHIDSREPRLEADLAARLRQGTWTLEVGKVRVPGAQVALRGWARADQVALDTEVALSDISAVRRSIDRTFSASLPPLRGEGSLSVELRGPLLRPTFRLRGDLEDVAVVEGAEPGPLDFEAEGRLFEEGIDLAGLVLSHPEGALRLAEPTEMRWGPEGFRLAPFRLELRGLRGPYDREIAGEAEFWPDGGRGRFRLERLRLEDLPQHVLPEALRDVAGRLDGELRFDGPWSRPEWEARFTLRQGAIAGWKDLASDIEVRARRGRIAGSLHAFAGHVGRVDADFDLPLRLDLAPPSSPLALHVVVSPIDLGQLRPWVGSFARGGWLHGRLHAEGTLGAPRLDGGLRIAGWRPPEPERLGPLDVLLRFGAAEARMHAELEVFQGVRLLTSMRAEGPFDAGAWRRDPERALDGLLASPEAHAVGEVRGLDLAPFSSWVEGAPLDGRLSATFDLRGPARLPTGSADVEVVGGPIGPFTQLDGRVSLLAESARCEALGQVSVNGQEPLRWEAAVATSLAHLLSGEDLAPTPLHLVWELPPLDLRTLPVPVEARGILRSTGNLGGNLGTPRGVARAVVEGLQVDEVALGGIEVRVSLDGGLDLGLFAVDPSAGIAELRLGIEDPRWLLAAWRGGSDALARMPAVAELRAEAFSIAPLRLLSSVGWAEGELYAGLRAEGRVEELWPVGELYLRRGVVEVAGGLRYDRVEFHTDFTEERIDLRLLEAHEGQGLATLRGSAEGRAPMRFGFDLRANSLPIGTNAGALGRASTRGRIEGSFDPRDGLEASVVLRQSRFDLAADPPRNLEVPGAIQDVRIVTGPQAEKRLARRGEEKARPLPLRVSLRTEDPVLVQGPDLALTAVADLRIHSEGYEPLLAQGSVLTDEGQATLLGRTFDIEESALRWRDVPLDDPDLDVTVRYDAGEAIAWVDVVGTLQEPEIRLRSEPPMTATQIAQLVASGRGLARGAGPEGEPPPGEPQEEAVGAAASVLGTFAASQLRQTLAPGLPLDVLTVQAGGGAAELQAGTYLGRDLYLGYARNLLPSLGENVNEVRAGYRLSRSFSIQSRFGDAGNGGVDLVFQRELPTAAQLRAREEREAEEGEDEEGGPPVEGSREGEDAP